MVVIKVAELVEAALQITLTIALLFGYHTPRNKTAPAKVGANVPIPGRSAIATAELVVGFSLNRSDARIDFTGSSFAFDIAATVTPLESEFEVFPFEELRINSADSQNRNKHCR